jgi:hypothetical protein
VFHPSCTGSEGSGSSSLLPTLAYQVERVAQCNEGVFARRSIDDLIDSKTKGLRGTAGHSRKAVTLILYRIA